MKNFFPIKLTALAYVLFGTWLLISTARLLDEAPLYVLVPYVLLILLGLGLLKKEKSVAIFSLVFLPLLLIWEFMIFIGLAFGGGSDLFTFLVSITSPPVLFILTIWSLVAMKKDKPITLI